MQTFLLHHLRQWPTQNCGNPLHPTAHFSLSIQYHNIKFLGKFTIIIIIIIITIIIIIIIIIIFIIISKLKIIVTILSQIFEER